MCNFNSFETPVLIMYRYQIANIHASRLTGCFHIHSSGSGPILGLHRGTVCSLAGARLERALSLVRT